MSEPAGVPQDPDVAELDDRDDVRTPALVGPDGLDHPQVACTDQPTRPDGRRVREGLPERPQVVVAADALAGLRQLQDIVGMAQLIVGGGTEALKARAEEFADLLLGHRADLLVLASRATIP